MRFIAGGPSIPDDLLVARDAGQVLFFCGAGVSRAHAHLPDFVTLAEKVLALLGSASDSPARKLSDAMKDLSSRSQLPGLVPTDRIFGMLDREFDSAEVRESVAAALRPAPTCSLTAHQILLDLSRSPGGTPRLVTTNFDLLFEECDKSLQSFSPPKLPAPNRKNDFRGIIHIHGCVDQSYVSARDNDLVLSSADFGHAYLSDGWATRYIQSLLEHFHIVFVGYSADDAPVQYLLEALNSFAKPRHSLFAFQSGANAAWHWRHKGVVPITYDSANGHEALWQTLAAWAERARDVEAWHSRQLIMAENGPATLAAHERGIIAHIASSKAGAKLLHTSQTKIPSDWIFVFDPKTRYGEPDRFSGSGDDGKIFDPFDSFCLDSDEAPPPSDPNSFGKVRDVPNGAWDGLSIMPSDLSDLSADSSARLLSGSASSPRLPDRLWNIGMWIKRVAHQPAALWWAASQSPLHHDVISNIEWSLRQESALYGEAVVQGWRVLLASWRQEPLKPSYEQYAIVDMSKPNGWTRSLVRDAMALYRPRLTVAPAFGARPPQPDRDLKMQDIVHVGVEYPKPDVDLEISVDMLAYALSIFRQHIKHGIELEGERNLDSPVLFFDSLRTDGENPAGGTEFGLTGHLVAYTKMVLELAASDPDSARAEMQQWAASDEVSVALRVWSAGHPCVTGISDAESILLSLDDKSFWESRGERDLLMALRDRWHGFTQQTSTRIEERLLYGEIPWLKGRKDQMELEAHYRLCRIYWLKAQKIQLSSQILAQTEKLRSQALDWNEDSIEHTATPRISMVRELKIDKDSSALNDLPIAEVLRTAHSLGEIDARAFRAKQPFRGLVESRPTRAICAIKRAADNGEFYPWAWNAVLQTTANSVSSRMRHSIAHRLLKLSTAELCQILNQSADWILAHSRALASESPSTFYRLWAALTASLHEYTTENYAPSTRRRWADESINRPAGVLAQALFRDPQVGVPDVLTRLEQLLTLPGDHRRYCLVIVGRQLTWLFHVAPDWTCAKILPISREVDDDADALWSGFFWGARQPQEALYLLMKESLLRLSRQPDLRSEHAAQLGGMLLLGWLEPLKTSPEPSAITSTEFREALIHSSENLRLDVLRHFKLWMNDPERPLAQRYLDFLQNVWPKQLAVRSRLISGRLAELAFEVPSHFPEIVALTIPRLTRVNGHQAAMTMIGIEEAAVKQNPAAALDLLWTILDDNPQFWPYKASDLIEWLDGLPEVETDPRLGELRKRRRVG